MSASPDGLAVVLPDALVDELVARIARPAASPESAVAVAAHLGRRRQPIYDLISQRDRRGRRIPHRKDGSRLSFRLSEIDARLAPPRRRGASGSSRLHQGDRDG